MARTVVRFLLYWGLAALAGLAFIYLGAWLGVFDGLSRNWQVFAYVVLALLGTALVDVLTDLRIPRGRTREQPRH